MAKANSVERVSTWKPHNQDKMAGFLFILKVVRVPSVFLFYLNMLSWSFAVRQMLEPHNASISTKKTQKLTFLYNTPYH